MSDSTNPRWRLLDGYTFSRHSIGSQCIIYHPGSGDTHLIDEASLYIVESLGDNVLTQSELEGKISTEFAVDSQDDLHNYVTNALAELKQLAIVEKIG